MYKHNEIEKKWQSIWEETNAFKTTNDKDKKYYALDMFPYPSGSGLHVGHPEGYTATDIISRMKRLEGFDVLHPMGWDAFGLPAEQYAIKTGNHPAKFTNENIEVFKKQLKSLGFSFDWSKEINTTDPAYYKNTQWIFNELYKQNLAEIREVEVNWCEGLGTVLANEEVIEVNGKSVSERGEFPVVKKPMKQWVLKITEFADELYNDLDLVDWPKGLINLQRNWIKNEDGTLHLRDWIFSRQRYWGEPFPILHGEDGEIKVIEDLPVILPEMDEVKPSGTGESPLANNEQWLYVNINNKKYRRETNTMPQWAGSCWYYLGYILKNDDGTYLDIYSDEAKKRFRKWLPVDLYIGGQEHAVLHLLYARFWHKVLYKIGIVETKEPFLKIVNQGMILGTDNQKMSKSKGNVINPDEIVDKFGADTLRLYEMFMGPLTDTKPWSEEGVKGIRKWLERVYKLFENNLNIETKNEPNNIIVSNYHKFVGLVTKDIKDLKFNTAISKMMVYINSLYKTQVPCKEYLKSFAIILSTFAPHIAEELLNMLGEKQVMYHKWPSFDPKLIKEEAMEIAVQVNGKLRATILMGSESKDEIIQKAKTLQNVAKYLEEKEIVKEIYVPNKIINIVVK